MYPWPIGEESSIEIEENGPVTISFAESLSPVGSDIVVSNVQDVTIEFGAGYFIQIQIEGRWYDINYQDTEENRGKNFATMSIAYILKGKKEKELFLDWSSEYGELPSGNYRFVKEFYLCSADDYTLGRYFFAACPFIIE